MGKKVANILKGEIASSVFYILFGVCLALFAEQTVNIICKVVFGLIMAGTGIYHVCIYASEKEKATILDMFTGVIVFVLGCFLFFTPQVIIKLLPYLLGAFVLVDSIWTLKGSWKLKKLNNPVWKVFLTESLVFVAAAVFIIVYPFSKIRYTAMFAGYVMLVNGIGDLVFLILLRKGIKKGIVVKEPAAAGEKSAADTVSVKEEAAEVMPECEAAESVRETAVESGSDDGEAEEELREGIVINGRWKSAKDELGNPAAEMESPAAEIEALNKAETAKQETLEEEMIKEMVKEMVKEENLEEWKD